MPFNKFDLIGGAMLVAAVLLMILGVIGFIVWWIA